MTGGPPDKHDAPYPDLNTEPANKTLEELIEYREYALNHGAQPVYDGNIFCSAFRTAMSLAKDRFQTLDRPDLYNEIEDVVRPKLAGEG